ncbi:MAG: YfhO family protein [Bacteroidales bacterium]|nr:YfhO family protein [Bacteroidales bacterium]
MDKKLLKSIGIAAGVVAFFLILSYAFVPQVLTGKIVNQSDISGYVGMSQEMHQWNKAHPDDPAYWSDSMFGGMPTTAIAPQKKGDLTQPLYDLLLLGKRPATYLFVALLGAFLMFLAFGVSWPLAVGGAIAVAFCSYNFQIIQVGHNTKMQAIAFMPWVLAAMVWAYRSAFKGKKALALLASALFGLAVSLEVKANHQQITYYLAGMILIYALVLLVDAALKHKDRMKAFWLTSALLLVLGLAGAATNANKLLPIAKYTPNTMRGGSELASADGGKTAGLDLAYATSWSYGWQELPNLMIPNWNGGASAQAVNPNKSATIKLLRRNGQNTRELAKALPMYWGPQPFTAGPMYIGTISVFLFVLGLCLYKRKEKWWLLAATVVAVFMALGSHFMPFTKLCFNILPLYNKFRTVSMALVVLQVSVPLLGILTLDQILKGGVDKKQLHKGIIIAGCITGAICLLGWLVPGIAGDFRSASDSGMQAALVDALRADRKMLLRNDSFTALILLFATAGLLRWAMAKSGRMQIAGIGICVLIAVNMFVIGKRYLNADHFTTPRDFNKAFAERQVDRIICADEDPSYRVLDLSVNVFNSSVPSYRHKSIGGYSPAKLQRYQDLIDNYLNKEINGIYGVLNSAESFDEVEAFMASGTPVLNALNTRYVILDAGYPPLVNPAAMGPAWLVRHVTPAESPAEEIKLLGSVDLGRSAVIGPDFTEGMGRDMATIPDGIGEEDFIEMVSYSPNELHYRYRAEVNRLAVFSEIYYPNGWTATVDGSEIGIIRADWTLRAAMLPAGEHSLVMRFAPASYRTGAAISLASSILLLLLLLGSAAFVIKK